MSTKVKQLSPAQIDALYERLSAHAQKRKAPQYAKWMVSIQGITVTAWNSGKVVFQGDDIDWLADSVGESNAPSKPASNSSKKTKSSSSKTGKSSSSALSHNTFPQAGSDEVGTGDYIGPVVVAGVIVPDEKTAEKLRSLQITDSKAMRDDVIVKVAPEIEKLVPHSIVIVNNPLYNEVHDARGYNLNKIKAMLHNQVYLNLQKKGYTLPELCMVDQFCAPDLYYRYLNDQPAVVRTLHFQTKAESSWIAVAAASVLARYAFLKAWEAMEEKYGVKLEKGGGANATSSAKALMKKIGKERMGEAVKLHFANSVKIGLKKPE